MTTGQIDPRYGDPSATAPPWGDIEGLLRRAQLYWIITVRVDGRPHAVPLVGVWHAGAFAFCTGPAEQKHLNLDANAQVAVTTRKHRRQRVDQRPGCRGRGHGSAGDRRRGPALVMSATLADAWFAKYGDDWRFEVQGREFVELSDSGGSATGGAHVYRVETAKVMSSATSMARRRITSKRDAAQGWWPAASAAHVPREEARPAGLGRV